MLRVGFASLANASFMQLGVEQQIEVFVPRYGYIGVTVPSYGVSLSLTTCLHMCLYCVCIVTLTTLGQFSGGENESVRQLVMHSPRL